MMAVAIITAVIVFLLLTVVLGRIGLRGRGFCLGSFLLGILLVLTPIFMIAMTVAAIAVALFLNFSGGLGILLRRGYFVCFFKELDRL